MGLFSWLFGETTPAGQREVKTSEKRYSFETARDEAKEYLEKYYKDPTAEKPQDSISDTGGNIQYQTWHDAVLYNKNDEYDADRIADYILSGDSRGLNDCMDASFTTNMLKLMVVKGMTATDVYNAAGIDRKLYSKISNDKDYKPSKDTCLAICIALKLTYPQTRDMLTRAGYSLSHSIKKDVVIEYCIKNRIWPISKVDEILYSLDLDTIGKMSS